MRVFLLAGLSSRLGDHCRYVAQQLKALDMKYVIIALLIFTVSSTAGYKDHRALVFESSVEVTRTERVEHEHSVELAAHHFLSLIHI